jgi:hypothetical protein
VTIRADVLGGNGALVDITPAVISFTLCDDVRERSFHGRTCAWEELLGRHETGHSGVGWVGGRGKSVSFSARDALCHRGEFWPFAEWIRREIMENGSHRQWNLRLPWQEVAGNAGLST